MVDIAFQFLYDYAIFAPNAKFSNASGWLTLSGTVITIMVTDEQRTRLVGN